MRLATIQRPAQPNYRASLAKRKTQRLAASISLRVIRDSSRGETRLVADQLNERRRLAILPVALKELFGVGDRRWPQA